MENQQEKNARSPQQHSRGRMMIPEHHEILCDTGFVIGLSNQTIELSVLHRICQKNRDTCGNYRRHPNCCWDSQTGQFCIGSTGGAAMNVIKRLCAEEDGQGLVEYTLVVVLVALVFWMGVRDTNVGTSLSNGWSKVLNCVTSPLSCSA